MDKIGYREIILRYVNDQKPEQPIITKQVAKYVSFQLEMREDDVRKAVNVNMARLEQAGHIVRLTKGVYCRKIKTAFGYYVPNKELLFCRQLVRDETGVIGYETGLSALNKMGLVSQMPKHRCIATNLHTKKVPSDIQIEIHKPAALVTNANYRYLQLLDAISTLDRAPVDAVNPGEVIKGTAKELELSQDILILLARKYYNQKTLLRTIDIMLEGIYEASQG